jgi:hypothetical protein
MNRFIRCSCGGALNAVRTLPSQEIDGLRVLAVRERLCDNCQCRFTTVEAHLSDVFEDEDEPDAEG